MYFDEERGTCDRFSYYSSAKQELDSYPELREISDKILKAVCYVYDKSKSDDFDVDTCKFLYFWLGNTLINKLNNTHFFAEAIIWLFRKLNENDNRKVCNVPYTDIDEGHFKKIKLIFEYFEDYEKYKLDFAIHNRSCNEDYYTYLKTYVDNYKQLHNECITERQRHMYCTEFVKYYDPQKHNDLLTWSCNLKETSPESNALPSNAEDLENQKKIDDRPRGVEQETKMKQRPVMAPQEHVRNPASLEPNLDSVTSETAITSNDSTRSITSKSITGAVSVAGILVPSYLMYNVISVIIVK
ncbi:hypothetical protein PVMG_01439 [Plasmodium vivax Mauritania I]|uniref:Variable surface protein Vir7-like protein n=1 Tax=Plasmodium vivax Mauritania I TaxID=1035515 RepID=A0A0J9VYY6_PLAVI|nr:hypothetical protein PVMG_01439 [Plasmodium vivax Mauritania I]